MEASDLRDLLDDEDFSARTLWKISRKAAECREAKKYPVAFLVLEIVAREVAGRWDEGPVESTEAAETQGTIEGALRGLLAAVSYRGSEQVAEATERLARQFLSWREQ